MWFDFLVIAAVFRAFQMLFRRRRKLHDGSDGLLKLKVAKTFQVVYGGNVYQALRIPDTGHRGHQVIDALLLTDREMYIFSIQNLSGIVRVCNDGTWMETDMTGNAIAHPNAVTQLQEKASVLAQYIARRGVPLPEKFYNLKVVFVNPSCSCQQFVEDAAKQVVGEDKLSSGMNEGRGAVVSINCQRRRAFNLELSGGSEHV